MSKLEDHLDGVINVFHQYPVQMGHFDKLSKGDLKQLVTKELANTLKCRYPIGKPSSHTEHFCSEDLSTECIKAIKVQMVVTRGYEQLGKIPGDPQTYFRLAGGKFCSSTGPYDDNVHMQHTATTKDGPSAHVPQERGAG
ncbi:hypothetical protein HPG69_007409 [Diceros bicornis minor]|uniref:S100/CaBP-9k-type calcium binding subdomain domain-containing protein n=1 Tax=Diceros bicornis minor TaxID=77932 RepID=A0A7J7F861_DICBM|nr:hypothetical protein HPG69_007409 [Diceros bicornis minor]